MARVPYLSETDVAEADRDLLARRLNLYYALAHSPAGARAFAEPALYLRHRSRLDARLRELAIIQVGYATGSRYEYAHHVELGRQAGLSDEDIRAIARETAGEGTHLTAIERAVLAAAREIVIHPEISDDTFAFLDGALGHERLVDLLMAICVYCGVVRMLGTLRIDVEPAYEHYLREFPLAK
jgi:alkylhydroperoxidase family enzyme